MGSAAVSQRALRVKVNVIRFLNSFLVAFLVLIAAPPAHAASNGLALTPPMGWNSWNHFGCNLNESVIQQTASAMVSSGMQVAGYEYINLDDCWMASSRDANGNLVPDPVKFPSGMPALVGYIHNLGLKIGLYEDAGTATCQGYPGSYGYYQQDANTFASWGIDYIKLDWCNTGGNLNLDPPTQYAQFAQALANSGRPITLSICDWGADTPWVWGPATGNLWRTTGDIGDSWLSMVTNMDANSALAGSAAPGAWNDPDMLEVGNGGMTDAEYQTHFSMWAMMAAPLIAGNDLTNMDSASLATLTNSEVIAVDQDPSGVQGVLLFDNGSGQEAWAKKVSGATVVSLLNESASTSTVTFNWSDIGLDSTQTVPVRDLWAHRDLGTFSNSFSAAVPSHSVVMLKIGAVAMPPVQNIYEADASGNTLSGQAVLLSCDCLDGNSIGYIGNDPANFVTINNVQAPAGGSYEMTVYASVDGTRSFSASVNGGIPVKIDMTGTSFSVPSISGTVVELNAGSNSIQFSNATAWAPNLDHIVLSPRTSAQPGFNISYPTQDLTLAAPGQTGTAMVGLIPVAGFTGTVTTTCSLPPAMTGASCAAPATTLDGLNSASVSVVIATSAATPNAAVRSRAAEVHALAGLKTEEKLASGRPHRFHALLPISGLALCVFVFFPKRARNSTLLMLLSLAVFPASLIGPVACGGNSPLHSESAVCSTVPNPPTSLAAASTTSSAATLSWSPGAIGSNCAITGYSIYQNSRVIATSDAPTYAVTGLAPATTYTFSVAENDSYGPSLPSLGMTMTTGNPGNATLPGTYPVTATTTSGAIVQSTSFNVIVD
jgi:alpha-galactosidase